MKNWMKIGLGVLAGGLIGAGAAFLGKKHENDEDYVEVEMDEANDSDSDEEAE